MTRELKNVMLAGAGGLFGKEVLAALEKENVFNITILSRKGSPSVFPPRHRVIRVDDDYPIDQLTAAFAGQDAVVSSLPGRPHEVHLRMIDAAARAGVARFLPSEYGNNTCAAAADLVPLYAAKAKVIEHARAREASGLTWTAVHCGQFFDWGLGFGWLDYQLGARRAVIYDSGEKRWSTTTIGTVAAAVARVLRRPEQTRNRAVYVSSFTVSQLQVLEQLERATGGAKWDVRRMTSAAALERARAGIAGAGGDKDVVGEYTADGLKLPILMLLYADDADRGANFEKDGLLDNELLGLPVEDMAEVVDRVVRQQQQQQQQQKKKQEFVQSSVL